MAAEDAVTVAELTGQLGYPSTPADIARRFRSIDDKSQVLVAEDASGRVVGWIHILATQLLEADGEAEIGGLVVAEGSRGGGIGAALVSAAEAWASARGYRTVRVRSNVVRTEAHRFYERLGYGLIKTQKNFRKSLAAAAFLAVAGASVEQTTQGTLPPAAIVESFDGLGAGFEGPQGTAALRNPSDNSLAVGPNHIVQTVNSRIAIFTKKGRTYAETGKALYGPVPTNTVFKDFGGACEARNNGDAVVRYDQLADRWLIVMPVFSRGAVRPDQPQPLHGGAPAQVSPPGRPDQPGRAAPLVIPPPAPPEQQAPPQGRRGGGGRGEQGPQGPYSMCYAVSASDDPLGSYYRYEFLRPYFPDYPRPAVWPDGYYVPTSSSDNRISDTIATQKHACVAERAKMLRGEPAKEQCFVLENVGFLNNADLDGKALPPAGAPNVMMAAGGTQLDKIFQADTIDAWRFSVDWNNPSKTAITGPQKIAVAPYHYLCDGQLTNCVPQPGTDRRLDAQGDKIMSRLVYRRVNGHESIVAVHSVNSGAGGGGVRWYEFRIAKDRRVTLEQQGTYAPDEFFRWLPSPAIDRLGNIGIGYSFGGGPHFAGQRFAGRRPADPPGTLTLREAVLAEGEDVQAAMRWEDYTQTAMDPSDDCTIWYVGDYLKKGAASYSSKIGAFRLPGCGGAAR